MKFRLYRQTKSAMQSGKKNAKKWLLVPIEEKNQRQIDPLMGWIGTSNAVSQLKFQFSDKESAIAFAKEKGFEVELIEPKESSLQVKSYAENFTS